MYHKLKMIAKDGKNRMTDVVDIEGMFRLIESIPSKKVEPIKLWLARLGKEKIDKRGYIFDAKAKKFIEDALMK